MDVREKLVEILKQAPFEGKVLDEWWWEEKIARIADHLIANGVTVQNNTEINDELLEQLRNAPITILQEEPTIEVVQEWISVKDRLPEEEEKVLIYTKTGIVNYGTYTRRYGFDCKEGFICSDGFMWLSTASHWCCLPQPPKGE